MDATPVTNRQFVAFAEADRSRVELDNLFITHDAIVLYTTDNGRHMNSWPNGAMTLSRSKMNTNWEGAFRVPCMIRSPGHIKPGEVSKEIVSGPDLFPTLLQQRSILISRTSC